MICRIWWFLKLVGRRHYPLFDSPRIGINLAWSLADVSAKRSGWD